MPAAGLEILQVRLHVGMGPCLIELNLNPRSLGRLVEEALRFRTAGCDGMMQVAHAGQNFDGLIGRGSGVLLCRTREATKDKRENCTDAFVHASHSVSVAPVFYNSPANQQMFCGRAAHLGRQVHPRNRLVGQFPGDPWASIIRIVSG